MEKVHDQPMTVAAEDGTVLIDGKGGVAVAMTPEAAIETADRLLDQGVIALGQQAMARAANQYERELRGESSPKLAQ